MKTLFIIRHSKSSWKDLSLLDFDRPLNTRGRRDAPFMGEKLKDRGIMPDIIISSPAKRAKSTIQRIVEVIGYEKEIIYNQKIYESNMVTLKKIIKSIDDKNSCAFIVGHNPGLNMFVEDFCDFYDNIPTTGIVELEFNCDSWEDIDKFNCEMADFDYPKRYLV